MLAKLKQGKTTNTNGMIYDLIKLVVFIVFICLGNRMAVFCKCTVANFKQWSYIQRAPSRAIIIQLCSELILMWRSYSDVYICTLYSSKCFKVMCFLKALLSTHLPEHVVSLCFTLPSSCLVAVPSGTHSLAIAIA